MSTSEIRHVIGAQGELKLRSVSGAIQLRATDGEEAVVRVTSGGGEPRLNVERSPGGLLVEPANAGVGGGIHFGQGGELDFEVELPRAARLDIKTVSADVDASGLVGEQRYKAVSGDIRLTATSGPVSAVSVSGDVRVHQAGDVELDAATTSGDVSVEAQTVRRVAVRTVSGDVRVCGRLQAGTRHSVDTVSGDLLLEPYGGITIERSRALDFARRNRAPTVIGDGSATLFFRSMSGESRVRPPAGLTSDEHAPMPPAAPPLDASLPEPPRAPEAPPPLTVETPVPGATPEQARLAVLRALERGEIDVDEAARRLEVTGG